MLRMALEANGYKVFDANNAHQATNILEQNKIDLILLDWMMPGVSGINFASKIRKSTKNAELGIIMLTARDDESDMIRGLEIGADDYITKPFSIRELHSRVRAVLRRLNAPTEFSNTVTAGDISIDSTLHRITINGQAVDFSPTEFKLLHFLLTHPDRVYARDQLLDNVWGKNIYVEDRTVDVHIRRLRKVLQPFACDSYITTVRGVGYRFCVPKKTN
jgi:two-component system phosphate regulon response regulator PhoB